jgi:hypothetical protein
VARPRAAVGLRLGHRRRRRAWPGHRLAPRPGVWQVAGRGSGKGLAGRGQRRAQHHDHPLERPAARQPALPRILDEEVGAAGAGPALQRDGQPARHPEPVPHRLAARRLPPPGQRDDPGGGGCRTAGSGRGARDVSLAELRRRPLSHQGRTVAAPGRNGAARRGGPAQPAPPTGWAWTSSSTAP